MQHAKLQLHFERHFLNDIETLKDDQGVLFAGYDFDVQSNYYPEPGHPIAYVSGSTISLNVAFESDCDLLPPTIGIGASAIPAIIFQLCWPV